WVRPPALVRMNVGAADRRHRHPHQNFAAPDGTQREFLKDERRVRRFVNGGLGGPHHSTPFSAKSKMSELCRWPASARILNFALIGRDSRNGTFCSPRPPWDRNRWPASWLRS